MNRVVIACLTGLLILTGSSTARSQSRDLTRALDAMPRTIPFPAEAATAKSALARRSDKIDPQLHLLADDVSAKGLSDFAAKAAELGIPVQARRALVTLYAEDDAAVNELRRDVERRGGVVQATFSNAVLAEIPPAAIEGLASIDALYLAAPQATFSVMRMQSPANGQRSEGLVASRVQHLHGAGVTGKGVKVGILDFGFQGMADLVAKGDLPRPRATKVFGAPSIENGERHGAACAEIIHAMAPSAELYIASVGRGGNASLADIVAGAQWLASQRVDIISFSGGGHFGPHNGKGLMDRLVDSIVKETGALWVNAAGNEGLEHFSGMGVDRDGDGLLDLDGKRGLIALQPDRNGEVAVLVNWDDWGADPTLPSASTDIDAFLFAVDANGELHKVAESVNPQRGRGQPLEILGVKSPDPKQVFVLALRATNVTRPVKVHVYALAAGGMEPRLAKGSIGVPATAESALAVGAVDVRRTVLEEFSGQGPTDDGRQKPDVSAPDRTMTISYRTARDPEGRFPGTSAACPHVSGFAALLKQLKPSAKSRELAAAVVANVRDMGAVGPDNEYGAGHIDGTRAASLGETHDTAVTGESVVGVPEPFGSGLRQRDLQRLWTIARRDPSARIKVVSGTDRYRIGDGLKVGVRVDATCHFMLLDRDTAGRFSVLAPADGDGRLSAGTKLALPDGETWKVGGPAGQEGLLLVCAPEPVDLVDWIRDQSSGTVWLATATFEIQR